ncbi:MAG: pyridoxal phosphate-dependent aminotransferase [Anaerolineales bacterium]
MPSEFHGGLNLEELARVGVDPGNLLDFSTNVNPCGPSPAVRESLAEVDIASYPDPSSLALRTSLARANEVSPDSVLVGNGTADLLWLIGQTFLSHESIVVIQGPSFGEYHRASNAAGARVMELRADPPNFQPDIEGLAAVAREQKPDLLFVCTPNNPTGWIMESEAIERLAEAVEPGHLVLDEAYRGFTDLGPFGRPRLGNVISLRSMTKDFGLAGLRLGYALAEQEIVERLTAHQPPWSVNAAAQTAGLAAIEDTGHLKRSIERCRQWSEDLRSALIDLGALVADTPMHYFLIEVGDGRSTRQRLMAEGILVRDAASFGLPGWIRIGVRRPEENQRLLEAWVRIQEQAAGHADVA